MSKREIKVSKNEAKAEERLAVIVANLIMSSTVCFSVKDTSSEYIIEFSGGYWNNFSVKYRKKFDKI